MMQDVEEEGLLKRHMELLGDVDGIEPEALERLAKVLPDREVTYLEGVRRLHFEYEAPFIWAEDIVDALSKEMTPDGEGRLDLVDNEAFTVTRFQITPGSYTQKTVSINDILDKYSRDR